MPPYEMCESSAGLEVGEGLLGVLGCSGSAAPLLDSHTFPMRTLKKVRRDSIFSLKASKEIGWVNGSLFLVVKIFECMDRKAMS